MKQVTFHYDTVDEKNGLYRSAAKNVTRYFTTRTLRTEILIRSLNVEPTQRLHPFAKLRDRAKKA